MAAREALPPVRGRPGTTAHRDRATDLRENQRKHAHRVQTAMAQFREYEDRADRAYKRIAFRYQLAGLGRRLVDSAVIEGIVDQRNDRWRRELAAGIDPYEIAVPIAVRTPLPPEKERPRRKYGPVFFWG
jgi:hypothetical protein